MLRVQRVIGLAVLLGLLCVPSATMAARASSGYLTFEAGADGKALGSSIPGIIFSSSAGDWLYGDVRTHQYNAPYPQPCTDRPPLIRANVCAYSVTGNTFAWAGAVGATGRFAFTQGTATFVEAHIATGDGLTAIAYDAQDQPIAAQFLPSNSGTGKFGLLHLVARAGKQIASVSLSSTANFWLIDDLATDAPGVPDQRSSRNSALVTVVVQPDAAAPAADRALTYTIVATNRGHGRASDTIITVPFDAQKVLVVGATTSRPAVWVSHVLSESLELRTGPLASANDAVTVTLRLALLPGVAAASDIVGRLSFDWRDGSGGGSGHSNRPAPEYIGSDGYYRAEVAAPQASAAARRIFTAALFAPGESVALWLNRPDGNVAAVATARADTNGVVNFEQAFEGQAAGYYSLVMHGRWTNFTAVAAFQVE